ncbi:glutathione transferase GstA [Parachitinimonas caeni]|uniref:Glutathione transferase GstA n=1 Tax=Parachitinimonas caeni TaxID=3031301 RepID=A0ABT7DRK3_9NEIS|nr:glutathione transferase GstA [Parachitinimonas caeni]MDK2122698.1 glutathione transferase GstA [Parachitinimonas caeni]
MKLYFSPGACSLAVHIVLRELQTSFSLEKVDLGRHQTADGADYYQLAPKGCVPMLVLESGERLTEGPVINQYLADHFGRTDLLPAVGSLARYRVLEWLNYVGTELHKSFAPLFNPEVDAQGKAVFQAQLRKKFAWVSQQLADRPYLTGDTFSIADAYLYTVASWSSFVGLDLAPYAELQAFLRRVAERPAVKQARLAEGLPG